MEQQNLLKQAISAYLFQVNNDIKRENTLKVLNEHEYVLEFFYNKFSLQNNSKAQVSSILKEKVNALKGNEKDTLNRVINFIDSVTRTSYYQNQNDRLSFKINVQNVIDSSKYIKPKYEIFVFAKNVEGSHLRMGDVSRGGIRWSSLKDRYRFEVLQLVASQYLKNAVIVPEGAKGCFYIKEDLDSLNTEEKNNRAIANYRVFIKGLLDVTDNIVNGNVTHPVNTKIFDDKDPYLVVAADKGTARFSDIANEVSKEYNFWLQDAFASGGKHGYDHKTMGITAKGAWEVAKHHLSIVGIDVTKDEFTAVGVGDMGGDVFGNGMLEYKNTKLLAAFNHKHIFIDPNPLNLEQSYNERLRLFEGVLGWENYNKDLISKGGGVFLRSCDEITISAEIKELFAINKEKITPDDLIKAILRAKVDLLWFGGIGTYVLSSLEDNEKHSDKANKSVRITGKEVNAKVVAEGANLGVTTKARHEMNRNCVLGCGDIIDNSGGVFASDKEVNLKILLGIALEKGLLNYEERNHLLEEVQQSIVNRILYSNYQQALIISIEQKLENKQKLYNKLFSKLKEEISFNKENAIYSSDNSVYTKAELSLLLLCDKLILKKMISESGILSNDNSYEYYALDYFPKIVSEKYKDIIISSYPLKDSIIAMMLANKIANHYGIAFIFGYIEDFSLEHILKSLFAIEYSFNISSTFKKKDNACYSNKDDLYKEHINIIKSVTKLLYKVLEDTKGKNYNFKKQCEFVLQNYKL